MSECRNVTYATDGEAMAVVFRRSDNCVAYRCGECRGRHVSAYRQSGKGTLDVPTMMAEGRFIAG